MKTLFKYQYFISARRFPEFRKSRNVTTLQHGCLKWVLFLLKCVLELTLLSITSHQIYIGMWNWNLYWPY